MNRAAFYSALRKKDSGVFGTRLKQSAVEGIEAILDAATEYRTKLQHLAYMLATAYHETEYAMQPVPEIGRGRGRKYGVPVKEHGGQVAYGRGYVQLTWSWNYAKADRELLMNGALIRNYELALRHDIASRIMFLGMEQGWFTGKKLSDYIRGNVADYVGARRIINGQDKAKLIAGYAISFERALRAADYNHERKPQ
jgi:hypothetical protein